MNTKSLLTLFAALAAALSLHAQSLAVSTVEHGATLPAVVVIASASEFDREIKAEIAAAGPKLARETKAEIAALREQAHTQTALFAKRLVLSQPVTIFADAHLPLLASVPTRRSEKHESKTAPL